MTWLAGRKAPKYQTRYMRKPWAAVKVQLVGRNTLEVVPGSICILRSGVGLTQVPEGMEVTDPEGRKLEPSHGEFFVSTETFDPYHLVVDADRRDVD